MRKLLFSLFLVLGLTSISHAYNGTGNFQQEVKILSSAVRTSTTTSIVYIPDTATTLMFYLNISSASGTGGLQVRIMGMDTLGNTYFLNANPTAIVAAGQYVYTLCPGCTSTGGSIQQATATAPPSRLLIQVTHGDTSNYTYSLDMNIGG